MAEELELQTRRDRINMKLRALSPAWEMLSNYDKPFLRAFSDGDPITRGHDERFQTEVPGARGQEHTTIRGAGHFLQEDRGPELARVVIDFMENEPNEPDNNDEPDRDEPDRG